MKTNNIQTKSNLRQVYLAGIFLVLALPILTLPPIFFPPDWAKTILFRSVLSVIIFLLAFQTWHSKKSLLLPKIKNNKIVLALGGLFVTFLLATIFSQDYYFSLWGSPYRSGGFVTFAFYIVFAVLTFLLLKEKDWQKVWEFSFLTGAVISLLAFVQNQERPASTLGNPILLAIYLLILFFPMLIFAIKEPWNSALSKWKKIIYILALGLFLCVIILTGSRAAYLALILGAIYFTLFYPQKHIGKFKIALIIALIFVALAVYYVNVNENFPQFLKENKVFQLLQPRLSISLFLADPRFSAWQVAFSAIKEKPILGYGPENFSIGFDKYYNPALPYISKNWGNWYDKGHNIIIDTAMQAGILGTIAYLLLFFIVFFSLQKGKKELQKIDDNGNKKIVIHGIQTALIAYFSANFFSFDSFSSYLIYFLLIGYSMHLLNNNSDNQNKIFQPKPIPKIFIYALFFVLVFFLYQYNLKPMQIEAKINSQINADLIEADKNTCDKNFALADKNLLNHSFLDGYMRIKYIEFIKSCAFANPEKNIEYAKKGIEIMKPALKIMPSYSRLWIYLGSFSVIVASNEKDLAVKNNLLSEARSYFKKAFDLAPKHQEILIEQAKLEMIAHNYKAMEDYSDKCVALDSSLGECYWQKAISEIYLRNLKQAKENIDLASQKTYKTESLESLNQLINAFGFALDYQDISLAYQKLIKLNPDTAQYHSSLAFVYLKLKDYDNAKKEALIFLKLMPEAKGEVQAFLKTIP